MQRFTVHYLGQVQGVGFRYTAAGLAERFAVTGYVKNLPDGRVELVAEGEADEVRAFLAEVRQAMAANICDVQARESSARGEFADFSIAR